MPAYNITQAKNLEEMLHDHGLSIAYDRVLDISAQLGDAVLNRYLEQGVVCPPILSKKAYFPQLQWITLTITNH